MLRPKQITERQADGELENIYHDIKQTLRVSGVNLLFRVWAGYKNFLPEVWRAFRPNAETRVFEDMAAGVRVRGAELAWALGPLRAAEAAPLGQSQAYQLDAALDLYRYINPKLLLIVSAVAMALEGEILGRGAEHTPIERIERGIPARMCPMEMVSEKPDDKPLRELFENIKQTLSLKSLNSDYRTLALWPMYLFVLWGKLAPVVRRPEYSAACASLREFSRNHVRGLPLSFQLQKFRESGDHDELLESAHDFERLLPGLILNMTLTCLDRHPLERCLASPFPAASRSAMPVETLV